MPKKRLFFDYLDLKILTALPTNPLNLVDVARKINEPRETIRRRVLQLKDKIKIYALPDYSALGLSLVFVLVDGFNEKWIENIKTRYLGGIYRLYTPNGEKGLLTFYFPRDKIRYLQEYLNIVIGEKYRILSGINFLRRPNFALYNPKKDEWNIDWNKIVGNTINMRNKLKIEISPAVRFDLKDLFILRELRENALTTITSIARKLKVNPRSLLYHFHEHVPKVIKGFSIVIKTLNSKHYLDLLTLIYFHSNNGMLSFAGTIIDNPLVTALSAVIEEPYLFVSMKIPSYHLSSWFKVLSDLTKRKVIESVKFIGIYDSNFSRQFNIPFGEDIYRKEWLLDSDILTKIKNRRVR